MYDIVFLSYREPHAEAHWELLKGRFPRAKHVAGVSGIVAAHHAAATRSNTSYFWVVDADNVVDEDFDFTFKWGRRDHITDRVSVWRARNNANGLVYGYGGVKLLPRQAVLDVPTTVTDFTTSISEHFHVMDEAVSTTIINPSPFDAWKAGFRECVKLSSGIILRSSDKNEERLKTWMTTIKPQVQYGEFVMRGAADGAQYGREHAGDPEMLAKINDWEWLNDRFRETNGD